VEGAHDRSANPFELMRSLKLKYRNATLSDLPAIVDIYNSTIPSGIVTADTETVTVESREKWFYEHDPETWPLWVVEDDTGQMVGWVSFQTFYGRPAYRATAEISIYLSATHRGKGFGKEILQHCIEMAPNYGIKTLLGYILSRNEPSLELFRKMGFEEWGILPDIAMINSEEQGLKILGKRLVL
jgi:L-amino acid N-acyltransferase YncA